MTKRSKDTDVFSVIDDPNRYIGEDGLEVEEILQQFIVRYKDPYVAHRVASAIEYLLRAPLKNGNEDIRKARKNLDQLLEYVDDNKTRTYRNTSNSVREKQEADTSNAKGIRSE